MKALIALTTTAAAIAVLGEYRHRQRMEELAADKQRLHRRMAKYREYEAVDQLYERMGGMRQALQDRLNRGI